MDQRRYLDPEIETASREAMRAIQDEKFRALVTHAWTHSPFYRRRMEQAGLNPSLLGSVKDIPRLPFLSKEDLRENQESSSPWGDLLAVDLEACQRVHLTSGTTGRPLKILDTREDWARFCHIYARNLYAYGIRSTDMVMPAFSFGPWIGFWAGYYACQELGCLLFASGGMKTEQRVDALLTYPITVLGCTPSYANHMAEVAEGKGLDLAREGQIRISWHTGEPGAAIPGVREKIEKAYGCKCFDFLGSTEIGPWGFNCEFQSGITHVNEDWAFPEVLDLETDLPVGPGGVGELVLTNLERKAMPFLRYRTRDIVRVADRACPCGRTLFALEGSVLGRIDDMKKIRGIIVYPSKIEEIIRSFPEVVEFQVKFTRVQSLDEIVVRIEPAIARPSHAHDPLRHGMERALQMGLNVRATVEVAEPGTLPRWDHKAKRFVDEREGIPF